MRCCPLWVWRRQFLGLFTDGDVDELEEELKLLLDEAKPDHISLLPEVPPGVLQPSGGSGLLDSLPAAPRSPVNICEQLKRLTVTDTGRHSAISLLSSKKKPSFIDGSFFFSVQTRSRRKLRPDSWRRRSDARTHTKKIICTLLLYIRNILMSLNIL